VLYIDDKRVFFESIKTDHWADQELGQRHKKREMIQNTEWRKNGHRYMRSVYGLT